MLRVTDEWQCLPEIKIRVVSIAVSMKLCECLQSAIGTVLSSHVWVDALAALGSFGLLEGSAIHDCRQYRPRLVILPRIFLCASSAWSGP
ncbi:hypothetical protein KC364_g10 [Hortaea werneckii]|nr:hypothetical protein KC364_g10 [Hortaea werneckii]